MESHKRKDSSLMEHLEEMMVTFENCWVNVKHWKKLADKLRESDSTSFWHSICLPFVKR